MPMMQTLSHSTRAYIHNANGLPGFVFAMDIIKMLKDADIKGELEQAKKWQIVDLNSLSLQLQEVHKLEEKMR